MTLEKVTLLQLLEAREKRALRQSELLAEYSGPLVCFTMNIAGECKTSPLIRFAFRAGRQALEASLTDIIYHLSSELATGCEAFYIADMPAERLKALCLELENRLPVGRLYDMDVIGADGKKLERRQPRACLICGNPAAVCARSRAHGLDAVKTKTDSLLQGFAVCRLAELAKAALMEEVLLTPKPGLVDRNNTGAHRDMDIPLFEKSCATLFPYFQNCVRLGLEGCGMTELQREGLKAEQAMLEATGGVNTHKGAVYAFGLLLCAMGAFLAGGGEIFDTAAKLAGSGAPSAGTHGSGVLQKYGVGGARQEAERGFPTARFALKRLEASSAIETFLEILLRCQDTNILHRGGMEGLLFAREWAKRALEASEKDREALLLEMDEAFIEKNLSPGGCADVLAQALFLQKAGALLDVEAFCTGMPESV